MAYNYSIIIPHKNAPKLLEKLLNSIPVREDTQVIIIDDNSSHQNVERVKLLCEKYNNLELYLTNDGGGAGKARNLGISYAKGDWVLFADSDDVFFTENLVKLLDVACYSNYEVICWPVELYDCQKNEYLYYLPFSQELGFIQELNNTDILVNCQVCDALYRMFQPWHKMVKRSFLKKHNIQFSEIPVCNDLFFSELLAVHASCIGQCSKYIYKYIRRVNSLSARDGINIYKIRIKEAAKCNNLLKPIGKNYLIYKYFYFMPTVKKNNYVQYLICLFYIVFYLDIKIAYNVNKNPYIVKW